MAIQNSGYYATYVAKDGSLQHVSIRYSKQHRSFERIKKVFAEMLNPDLSPRVDPGNGKNLVTLVATDKLTQIGFFD